MEAIVGFLADHEPKKFKPLEPVSNHVARPKLSSPGGSAIVTLDAWRQGRTIPEIAAERGFTESTIEGHLAQVVESGEELDPRAFFSEAEEREMSAAMDGYDEPSLKPVFEQLEGRISYGKLKLFRAFSTQRSRANV